MFSDTEKESISEVVKLRGSKSAGELSKSSHKEPAWIEAKDLGELDPSLMAYGPEEDPEGL